MVEVNKDRNCDRLAHSFGYGNLDHVEREDTNFMEQFTLRIIELIHLHLLTKNNSF